MYEIRPESVKTFLLDRNIRLPRFQRKQTWDEKKNFQLCISLFKEYPIGVCILSMDTDRDKIVRWLLDGRQRKNALSLIYDDPENIYNWSRKFIKFRNSDQPDVVEEKFWRAINEYVEDDHWGEQEVEALQSEQDEDNLEANSKEDYDESKDYSKLELPLLLEIIKIIHNRSTKNSGFTKPYDMEKFVNKLPYIENNSNGSIKLSSKKLKTFLDDYRRYCDDESILFENSDSFLNFIDSRCDIKQNDKLKQHLKCNWKAMLERITIVEKIDNMLNNSKIGMIEVKNLSPSDSQKIFNIINSEGEKLTAVEILSAKPNWNQLVNNPSQAMIDSVTKLYKTIGTPFTNIVKWDLPATLLKRIGKNFILKEFTDKKTDFEKELTLGFKILSGIFEGGVKKEDIDKMSKNQSINWNTDIDLIINDFLQLFKLIGSFDYFKYMKSWKATIMELTSDAIALNFFILIYKDWVRKGKPIGYDTKARQTQKNSFILYDKLIYEYISKQWRGSSDSKIEKNISSLPSEPDLFSPLASYKWENLLTEILDSVSIDGNLISLQSMKPILYHFYCMSNIQGPDSSYDIEVDHIIPKSVFNKSTLNNRELLQDSIYNLGLLPKDENCSKGNKRLIEITDEWLKDQVVKYEFIDKKQFELYSDVNNYQEMFKLRKDKFYRAFTTDRVNILNN